MQDFPQTQSPSIAIEPSREAEVYGLFALAMALTAFGVFIGMEYAPSLMASGVHYLFLIAELGLIFTARLWMNKTPLNYILFGTFPLLSGFTITPYILYVLAGYANGGSILLNAFGATAFMATAAAVFARTTSMNLSVIGKALFMGLIGLIVLMIAQFFVPALRTTQFELMLSGGGIVIFAIFTAYDLQRIANLSKACMNPFMLALSLYLDIFNLFLFILRFMLVLSGDRR
ncbi:Bax inhibitor-1/YccA family protein [Patescibacteria group bacterium]|nr:Bax inhibitor-1/YccA family protein [Patescibacteria group bacterium]